MREQPVVTIWPPLPALPTGAKLGCGGKRWGDKGFFLEPTGGRRAAYLGSPAFC